AMGLDRVIKNYFDQYRSKNILPPFLNGKIPGKLITNLPRKGWLDFIDSKYEVRLGGYLDECIELNDKCFAAFDHKTRGRAPDSIHKAYQLQMDVYTFLLEENKFPNRNTAYIVYYIPKKIIPEFEFEFEALVKEITTDPKRAKSVFHEAIDALRNPIPPINKDCEFCKWTATLEIR
ncbi:MAG: PD-(D/E)XK nuclease family protein, partial [Candidatus Omnitrophica bacterium]|nr:PD-(D/E)XK nuclease family protein [Candidatus Omnitrophota bacterium]